MKYTELKKISGIFLFVDSRLYEMELHEKDLRNFLTLRPESVTNGVQSKIPPPLYGTTKKTKLKERNIIYKPFSEGGLNFINFRTMVKSLRLAWIGRLLSNIMTPGKPYQIIILTNMGD